MNKYVYLGTNENLNHRGFTTDLLCVLTKHDDCFYVKFDTLEHLGETKLSNDYLNHFKSLHELVKKELNK